MTDAVNAFLQSKIVTEEMDKGVTILKEAQSETEEMYLAGR
ncbi:hypothetical protein [Oscillibacter sp.]|nr:hypothetical protein [Oscillibacter sp.]